MANPNQPAVRLHQRFFKYSPPTALIRLLWALFLVTLPITSFPYFPPAIGGEALVRPLSLYPLALLFLLGILPILFQKPVPKTVLILLPFVAIAIASSLLSLFRGIETSLGVSAQARVLRGLMTLGIGSAVYLAVSILPENVSDLRFTLRWIYLGCALAMLAATLQAKYVLDFDSQWFEQLSNIQAHLSIRRLLPDRVSGLTYEPHWFAAQLILLLLPWALAAVRHNHSVFKFRWGRLTIELLLVLWVMVLMPLTYSRAGVLNLVGLIVCAIFFKPPHRKSSPHVPVTQAPPWRQHIMKYRILLESILALALVAIPVYLIGIKNAFFARIWSYWQEHPGNVAEYMSYLGFDARIAYAEAAYRMYQAYPFLGVGLGNYAFYFEEMLPYRPIANTPEVLLMITPEKGRDRLITSKNLYLRLLAETGIIGSLAFACFLIAVGGCALYLWLSPKAQWRYWGQASVLGMLAFLFSAITFDSFVIPNMWIVFGLITAATKLERRSLT